LHVGEQAGAGQGADRDVQHRRVDRVAGADRQIGQDRGLVDPLRALNQDAIDRQRLGRGDLDARRLFAGKPDPFGWDQPRKSAAGQRAAGKTAVRRSAR